MSLGSGPTATSSAVTTSATRRAIGPFVDRSCQSDPCQPPEGTRPSEGFMPLNPQHDDGMRIEPPPSEPVASGTMPDAMAAAAPPDDPPGLWARFHGLHVGAEGDVVGVGLPSELGRVGLSHHDATRRSQARHQGRVGPSAAGPPAKTAEPVRRDEARRVVEVLHADGDAGQRAGVVAAGHGVVDARRRFERVVGVDGDEGVHLGVERLDALERVGDELAGAPRARAHSGGQVGECSRRKSMPHA